MEPDEVVQISMTREEAARVHAALRALCELQRMMPGLPSAMQLTEAVEVLEGVLPRLAEAFPNAHDHTWHIEKVKGEAKTYASAFDVKVDDLVNITPNEAAAIFATEYDEAIRALLQSLTQFTDFTKENFNELLNTTKQLLVATMPVPSNLSVQDSQPYVQTSDLITLGALAYEMYLRQDQIEDLTKPF